MPITVAVCDDDGKQIAELRRMMNEWAADKPFSPDIEEYISAESFLFAYPENPCDILLLDIGMSGINGMELAKKLRARGDMLPIVFITGYSDYMAQGYDVEALHYLLKPVERERFFAVLDRFSEKSKSTEQIIIPCGGRNVRIFPDSVTYVEAFGRKTSVHLSDGAALECDMGIGAFAEKKTIGFVRCHRSYLVNLRYVRIVGKTEITLDSGEIIPLSRRESDKTNKAFIEYYTKGYKNGEII